MEVRFYRDPETDLPDIYGHWFTEEEVEQVLRASGGDIQGTRGSRDEAFLLAEHRLGAISR